MNAEINPQLCHGYLRAESNRSNQFDPRTDALIRVFGTRWYLIATVEVNGELEQFMWSEGYTPDDVHESTFLEAFVVPKLKDRFPGARRHKHLFSSPKEEGIVTLDVTWRPYHALVTERARDYMREVDAPESELWQYEYLEDWDPRPGVQYPTAVRIVHQELIVTSPVHFNPVFI